MRSRLGVERKFEDLRCSISDKKATNQQQAREIRTLQHTVGQLKKNIEKLTKKLGQYIQADATRLAQAVAAISIVHASPAPAAPALVAGSTANLESCQTLEVKFNTQTGTEFYVPVSEPSVLATLVTAH